MQGHPSALHHPAPFAGTFVRNICAWCGFAGVTSDLLVMPAHKAVADAISEQQAVRRHRAAALLPYAA